MPTQVPQTRTVVLTDAQIKALPTTPVELIPAPGVGKMIVPITAPFVLDMAAGNYVADVGASWLLMYPGGIYIGNPRPVTALLTTDAGIYTGILPTVFYRYNDAGFANQVTGNANIVPAASCENQAIVLKDDWNGVLDYTGGHANNTLTITIGYLILDI